LAFDGFQYGEMHGQGCLGFLGGYDHALGPRRVRLIPFKHVVPEDQRVLDLDQQLLAEEGPAILAWAVRGAAEVLADGLATPELVDSATAEYEASEDTVASFVKEECLLGQHYWVAIGDLRELYEQHCRELGVDPISGKALTIQLVDEFDVNAKGRIKRPKQTRIYKGIGVQAEDE
jgi:putative DNA primase/helicase